MMEILPNTSFQKYFLEYKFLFKGCFSHIIKMSLYIKGID